MKRNVMRCIVPALAAVALTTGACASRGAGGTGGASVPVTAPGPVTTPTNNATSAALTCPIGFPTPQQTIAWRQRVYAARETSDPTKRADAMAALVREGLEGTGLPLNMAGSSSTTQIVAEDYRPVPTVNFDVNLNQKQSMQFTAETVTRALSSNAGYYFTKNQVPYLVLGPYVVDARSPDFIREYTEHEMYHANHHVGDGRTLTSRELETWTEMFVHYFHRKYPFRVVWEPMLTYYGEATSADQAKALEKLLAYYRSPPESLVGARCIDETKAEFKGWIEQRLKDSRTATMRFVKDLQRETGVTVVATSTVAPRITYWAGAGDLTGDGRAEVLRWNSDTKLLAIYDLSSGTPKEVASHPFERSPNAYQVADLDRDGRNELILGEGLGTYNAKEGEQVDVVVNIYKPLEPSGWDPVEVYRAETERAEVTGLEVADIDKDKQPELVFSYFASKYMVEFAVANRNADGKWIIRKQDPIRMGTSMTVGPALSDGRTAIVVGRPYGDENAADKARGKPPRGDAMIVIDNKRISLPVHRGVSLVALGDVNGDRRTDVVVSDGWDSDYGKIARGRLSLLSRNATATGWNYEVIEDVPTEMRFKHVELVDLNGDGKDEIIAQGESRIPFKMAPISLYQKTAAGWRRATVSDSAQGYAIGDIDGNGRPELMIAGADQTPRQLDLNAMTWTTRLAPVVETFLNNPKDLIGEPATEIVADEWVGNAVTLKSFRGKVVLLDYWATWCAPCIAAFPELKRLLATYGPLGFTIIGVTNHSQQTSLDVRKMVADKKLSWPTAIDPGSRTHMSFGVQNLPHQIIIDQKGIIHSFYVGGGATIDQMERDIKKLLGKS